VNGSTGLRRGVFVSGSVFLLVGALGLAPNGTGEARAQAQVPGQVPDQTTAAAQPGVRLVTGQTAVVGGNSAGARERALDEALHQAVEQALAEQLDAQTRAAQARAIKTLQGRARSYIKRYRTVDETEANGFYTIRIEAEVDDAALRRATERWTAAPQPAVGAAVGRPVATSLMVMVSGPADAGAALLTALAGAGIRAQLGDPALVYPPRALQAAAKGGFSALAFVSATVVEEGMVRGPGQVAVSCQVAAKVVSVASGQSVVEASAAPRAFSDRAASARADCFARAAAVVAPRLLPSGIVGGSGGGAAGGAADLRVLMLDTDVVEPSAIAGMLRAVRGLGSVSSAEIRRIVLGRAEVRVRTRLAAPALATALGRDNTGPVVFSNVEVAGDLIRLRVRLRPPPPMTPPVATP
jgi:hypothetical protein